MKNSTINILNIYIYVIYLVSLHICFIHRILSNNSHMYTRTHQCESCKSVCVCVIDMLDNPSFFEPSANFAIETCISSAMKKAKAFHINLKILLFSLHLLPPAEYLSSVLSVCWLPTELHFCCCVCLSLTNRGWRAAEEEDCDKTSDYF